MTETTEPGLAPHSRPSSEVLSALRATPEGLSSAEAAARLAHHGPNRLPAPKAQSPLRRLAAQFHNILIYVLLGAAAITAGLGHWTD
ncbi:MAG TPA: cation-transporting P-type ATPase, partial [Paracoccaceae bacterium]